MRRIFIGSAAMVVLGFLLFHSLRLSSEEVAARNWKFCDEYDGRQSVGDFLHMDGQCRLQQDTVRCAGSAIATVVFALKWFDGRSKLWIRTIDGQRTVEYVDI